ncbi:hypothetical protein H8K35_18170 [Undibacterium sp. LX40W]|uniref:Tetratricopeptide repeat protein n=1 Tax=Undibacterium nitidum TaxID=2762298 RepID=A0A923HTY8_9BURK|nr:MULTISPECIES: DUF6624 domain-containing protein [Undibacterium]MBC3883325.1 hypothetical protein [Undibacterium nitidum]MBC3893607.1 hypothetical protein [Undibacterium sp. LX40W]
MKKWILAASIALAFSTTQAQSYSDYLLQARSALNNKDYKTATAQFKQAFSLKLGSYADLYDAACVAALTGDKDSAFKWLEQSIAQGWFNLDHLTTDSDLISLHKDKRWAPTLKTLKSKLVAQEKNYDHKLKAQLEKIYSEDQDLRKKLIAMEQKLGADSAEVKALWQQIDDKDEHNLKQVESIISENGWLGSDQVGPKASQTLFLVVQHARPEMRLKYVSLLRAAVKAKKADAASLALMEDRMATEAGDKQLYGSQLRRVNDQMELFPIADPDHLDERRASMGLPPIAEYVKIWKLDWDLANYKKQLEKYEAEQRVRVEDLARISDVLWRGQLSYLDYGKNVWVDIPSNLRVSKSEQEASTWLWSYGYDDEPHANAKDGIRLSEDGKKLGQEEVISRELRPNGALRIVTTMPGEDDRRPAQFRFTYTITADSFDRKKEVKLVGSEDYFVRHVYAWKK